MQKKTTNKQTLKNSGELSGGVAAWEAAGCQSAAGEQLLVHYLFCMCLYK